MLTLSKFYNYCEKCAANNNQVIQIIQHFRKIFMKNRGYSKMGSHFLSDIENLTYNRECENLFIILSFQHYIE